MIAAPEGAMIPLTSWQNCLNTLRKTALLTNYDKYLHQMRLSLFFADQASGKGSWTSNCVPANESGHSQPLQPGQQGSPHMAQEAQKVAAEMGVDIKVEPRCQRCWQQN